jgi:hypothetical protein
MLLTSDLPFNRKPIYPEVCYVRVIAMSLLDVDKIDTLALMLLSS